MNQIYGFPFYFIAKEIRIFPDGKESLGYYAVEKVEVLVTSTKRQIIETVVAYSPEWGAHPMVMTVDIKENGDFRIGDQTGLFEGKGFYTGPSDRLSVMRFKEANSKVTHEKFEGTYVFYSNQVRAIKHWYDENNFGSPDSRPKFVSVQDGQVIAEADYLRLSQNPDEIPSFWNALV